MANAGFYDANLLPKKIDCKKIIGQIVLYMLDKLSYKQCNTEVRPCSFFSLKTSLGWGVWAGTTKEIAVSLVRLRGCSPEPSNFETNGENDSGTDTR